MSAYTQSAVGSITTIVPVLRFGAGNTGMNTQNADGWWVKGADGFVDFVASYRYNIKGTSTGTITLELPGMPNAAAIDSVTIIPIHFVSGELSAANLDDIGAYISTGATPKAFFLTASGTTLTDAHASSATGFYVSGRYKAA